MSLLIGIDLGTLGARISTINRGTLERVLNEADQPKWPTLVTFARKQRYLGEPAVQFKASNHGNTIHDFLRLVGRSWSDPRSKCEIERLVNHDYFQNLPDDMIGVHVTHDSKVLLLDMRQVLAMYLGGLKRSVKHAFKLKHGREAAVHGVVLSVPPYYTDVERRAVLDSANIAELKVLCLMNENAAVALDYGFHKNARHEFDRDESHVMFVSVGYANAWVSIASFVKGKGTLKSCECDEDLGGRKIDDALVQLLATQFQLKFKLDPRQDAKALLKLRDAVEKAKVRLTPKGVTKTDVSIEYLMNEKDLQSSLTLKDLSAAVEPLCNKLEELIRRALSDAGCDAQEIDRVEVVGGSSRIPQFKETIARAMGLDSAKSSNLGVSTTLDADDSVSRGCALMCTMLSPGLSVRENFEIEERVSTPVQIHLVRSKSFTDPSASFSDNGATSGSVSFQLFKQSGTMSALRRIVTEVTEPFEIHVEALKAGTPGPTQGPTPGPTITCKILAKFKISGIPRNTTENEGKTYIRFGLDRSGIFDVRSAVYRANRRVADAKKSKNEVVLHVQRTTTSLKAETTKNWKAIEKDLAANDKARNDCADKRNDLEGLVNKLSSCIDDNMDNSASYDEDLNIDFFMLKVNEEKEWLEKNEEATFQELCLRLDALRSATLAFPFFGEIENCPRNSETTFKVAKPYEESDVSGSASEKSSVSNSASEDSRGSDEDGGKSAKSTKRSKNEPLVDDAEQYSSAEDSRSIEEGDSDTPSEDGSLDGSYSSDADLLALKQPDSPFEGSSQDDSSSRKRLKQVSVQTSQLSSGTNERRKWSDLEVRKLRQLCNHWRSGRVPWKKIAAQMGPSFTRRACRNKYQRLPLKSATTQLLAKKRPWTPEEVDKMMKEVAARDLQYLGYSTKWLQIGQEMERSTKSCQTKYDREMKKHQGGEN